MSINEYGLDADYFIKLCAREFSPEVIRSQRPADLARAFARAARTACAEVLDEREFASPAAEQPYSTTSNRYRAELYDEVWEKVRALGFGNVTEGLAELERRLAVEQYDPVQTPRELLERMTDAESVAAFTDDPDGYQCVYCGAYSQRGSTYVEHSDDCPVTGARALLGKDDDA